jgi:hypothetical protein
MPALLRKAARHDRTGWAGVGQASREETAGYAAVDQNRGMGYGDLKGGCAG